jgi:hypothetical protein
VLDTSVVRALIQGEHDAIDLGALKAAQGQHPIALADAVPVEIMDWLLKTRDDPMIARTGPVLEKLGPILDPAFPIAPGAEDITAFAGLVPYVEGRNRSDMSRFAKALWKHLRTIGCRDDISRPLKYRNSVGKNIVQNFLGTGGILQTLQDGWLVHDIAKIAQVEAQKRAAETPVNEYPGLSEEEVQTMIRNARQRTVTRLRVPPGSPAIERLELSIRHLIRWTRHAAHPSYKPPKEASSNDAVDAILLYYMVLPAVVCTADKRFVNSVREQPVPDRLRVMTPAELLCWLRSGLLPS